MINGIGFFEIFFVIIIVLVFFGSKEIPHFIREASRLLARLRKYSDIVKRELNEVSSLVDVTSAVQQPYVDTVHNQKKELRTKLFTKRKTLSSMERIEKSNLIIEHFLQTQECKNARVCMLYAASVTEVQTTDCINTLLSQGKRVVLPYNISQSAELGIAEIKDFAKDCTVQGPHKIMEPEVHLRGNFLKSDISCVVCPGICFDNRGARLGRGDGAYDYFLKELKDKVPLIGFAFHVQMLSEDIPFDYHDITMDMIITENGIVYKSNK